MRFFMDKLWTDPKQWEWGVFAEEQGSVVCWFSTQLGQHTAQRVLNKIKHDYAHHCSIGNRDEVEHDILSHAEVRVRYGKSGQEIGYERVD